MFSYKDKSLSPELVYSQISRVGTPLHQTSPTTSTDSTPCKDMEVTPEFVFGKPGLPGILVQADMEKYVADLTSLARPENALQAQAFHLGLEPAAMVKPGLERANLLPKVGLSIDVHQANTLPVAHPVRLAFAPSHSRRPSADPIWGAFTPLLEFFGKNITTDSLSSGMQYLNLKLPMKGGFYELPRSSSFAASVPRSATLATFFEPPALLTLYFERPEKLQIQQLTIDTLKNVKCEAVFASKAGQLPRFLIPGLEDAQPPSLVLCAFKGGRLDIFHHTGALQNGDLVLVEADRGKDLGMVVLTDILIDDARLIKMMQHEEQNDALRFDNGPEGASQAQPHIPKQVLRVALPLEVQQIAHKQLDEAKALAIMQLKIAVHKIPMRVLGAEYQWDRRKLTFYYVANKRIDFRDLVKDIFRIYKTRIWMCAVSPTDMSIKKSLAEELSPQYYDVEMEMNNYLYLSMPSMHQQRPSFGQAQFAVPEGHVRLYSSLGSVWN